MAGTAFRPSELKAQGPPARPFRSHGRAGLNGSYAPPDNLDDHGGHAVDDESDTLLAPPITDTNTCRRIKWAHDNFGSIAGIP